MSRHSSRKCSLAIESPIDNSCNNPLNAFLIYSGKTDTHSNNNNGADDEMATTDESMSPLASSTSLSPMTPPGSRNTTQLSNQQLTKPLRCHRRPSMIKCTSLPELTAMSTHTVTTSPPLSSLITNSTTHAILGNRRISICDLDNFTGEIDYVKQQQHEQHQQQLQSPDIANFMYCNLSTSDIDKTPRKFSFHHCPKTAPGMMIGGSDETPQNHDHEDNEHEYGPKQQEQESMEIDKEKEEGATQNTQLPHHYIENLASFQFRNHKRRNSTALKFEEPKIL